MQRIVKRLKYDHKLAAKVLSMLDGGYLEHGDAANNQEGLLPPSSNKFRLVHKDTLLDILFSMVDAPGGLSGEAAQKFKDRLVAVPKKMDICHIFAFLTRVDDSSAVPTRSVKELAAWCLARHSAKPRISNVLLQEGSRGNYAPAFAKVGCFQLTQWDVGQKKYTHVKHADGAEVPLPATLIANENVILSNNFSEAACKLQVPGSRSLDVKVCNIFADASVQLTPPYFEQVIQTPLNSSKRRARSSSPSSASGISTFSGVASSEGALDRLDGAQLCAIQDKTSIEASQQPGTPLGPPPGTPGPPPVGYGGALVHRLVEGPGGISE